MTQDLTELDILCMHVEERLNPEELIDALGLDISEVVELCRSHIAEKMEEVWDATAL